MKTANIIFTVILLLVLALPLLGIFGVQSFAKTFGVVRVPESPTYSIQAFLDGTFQQEFAARYEYKMFGREELLFLKNAIFDLANFGKYHSGHSGLLIQGVDGVLLGKAYINWHLNPPSDCREPEYAADIAESATRLKQELAKHGIAFGVVLAPSKADICEASIPPRFSYFVPPGEPFNLYAAISAELVAHDIPVFDGSAVFQPYKNTDAAFPYSGIHWNVWAAAVAATNLIPQINAQTGANLPIPRIQEMRYESAPYVVTDIDLAKLLNLPWKYRLKGDADRYTHVEFATSQNPQPAGAIVLGDSFAGQFHRALFVSGEYHRKKAHRFLNHIPSPEELQNAMADADVFFILYSAGGLVNGRINREMDLITEILRAL